MIAAFVLAVVGSILNWATSGLWEWVGVGMTVVAAIIVVSGLVRLVRRQRDDYWRERGHGPQNF